MTLTVERRYRPDPDREVAALRLLLANADAARAGMRRGVPDAVVAATEVNERSELEGRGRPWNEEEKVEGTS